MSETQIISISYQVHQNRSSLDANDLALVELAEKASEDAYAPYSGFNVGAALELGNGETVIGNNQENASFPAGICAERVAMFAASAQHPGRSVRAIAIIANSENVELKEPVPPCGICRQVVAEYEAEQGSPIRVILCAPKGSVHIFSSMKDLLPFHFHETSLKRHS